MSRPTRHTPNKLNASLGNHVNLLCPSQRKAPKMLFKILCSSWSTWSQTVTSNIYFKYIVNFKQICSIRYYNYKMNNFLHMSILFCKNCYVETNRTYNPNLLILKNNPNHSSSSTNIKFLYLNSKGSYNSKS